MNLKERKNREFGLKNMLLLQEYEEKFITSLAYPVSIISNISKSYEVSNEKLVTRFEPYK
jgi:hypothetical protein